MGAARSGGKIAEEPDVLDRTMSDASVSAGLDDLKAELKLELKAADERQKLKETDKLAALNESDLVEESMPDFPVGEDEQTYGKITEEMEQTYGADTFEAEETSMLARTHDRSDLLKQSLGAASEMSDILGKSLTNRTVEETFEADEPQTM